MQHLILSAADLEETAHLPEMIMLFISLVGKEATALLVNNLGGATFAISKNKRKNGQIRFAMLAEIVGEKEASTLTSHFGGETMYIPMCKEMLQAKRNRLIRADFDRLCQDYSASETVNILSIKYRLSGRFIWQLMKAV